MAKASSRSSRPLVAPAQRKARLILLGSLVLSAVILVAWFPAGALLHQRSDLASTTTELHQLHQEDGVLAHEGKNLSNSSEISRIAREQYQLVSPGQKAYEVLPPSGSSSSSYSGDPGAQAPSNPSTAAQLPTNGTTTTNPSTTHGKAHSGTSSTFDRMLRALEFWR